MAKSAKKSGGARKTSNKKAEAAPDQPTEAAKSSEVKRAISERKLKALLSSCRAGQQNITEIAGGLGSEIKTAVDSHHLNRRAFTIVRGLDRLEPEKLADVLDSLDHYLDISGLRDRAAQVQRMQFGPGNKDDGEGEEAEDGGNVSQFPQARGEAAE